MANMQAPIRPHITLLPDGRRLHLQDGPIDLIVEAYGTRVAIAAAYNAASRRFTDLLDELCAELTLLRAPIGDDAAAPASPVGRRMYEAVRALATHSFITPMAAVAGSVADEILSAMRQACDAGLDRAYVNNGGDIALHLQPGQHFVTGLVDRPDRPSLFGTATIRAGGGIGGIATSGAGGRSFSLGIADAVTILARNGAAADAAATIVANAVDLPDHPGIIRKPAASLQPDSDLGDKLVTRRVPPLSKADIDLALVRGAAMAECLIDENRIIAAALHLQGETRLIGAIDAVPQATPAAQSAARLMMHGANVNPGS